MSFLTQPRLERILENRERFMNADLDLGSILQALIEGRSSVENCLMTLVEQQKSYDQYISGIIGCLGTPLSGRSDGYSNVCELDN